MIRWWARLWDIWRRVYPVSTHQNINILQLSGYRSLTWCEGKKQKNVLVSGGQQSSRKGRKMFAAASSSFWQRGRAGDWLRAPWVIWVKCKTNHIPGRGSMFGLWTELKVSRSPSSEEEPKKKKTTHAFKQDVLNNTHDASDCQFIISLYVFSHEE